MQTSFQRIKPGNFSSFLTSYFFTKAFLLKLPCHSITFAMRTERQQHNTYYDLFIHRPHASRASVRPLYIDMQIYLSY